MTTATKEMKPAYKIFVLDSEEYDSLYKHYPMKENDLKDSLGFASQKTRECFVRRTGFPEWDEATIMHEAMELLAKHSEHEDENAIRWKKGKDIFASIIPAIVGGIATILTGGGAAPLVGPTMASILGGAASAGTSAITQKNMSSSGQINPLGVVLSGVGSGLAGSAMMPGVTAASQAGKGFLGQLGGGLLGTAPTEVAKGTSGLLGSGGNLLGIGTKSLAPIGSAIYPAGTPVGVTNMGTYSQFPGGSVQGLASAPVSTAPQTIGMGQSILGSAIGSGIGSTLAKTASNAPIAPTEVAPQSGLPSTISNLGKEAGKLVTPQNILGAGSLLASTMPKTPEFQMPDTVEQIRAKLLSGGSLTEQGMLAKAELSNILKSTPQELYPTANDAYYNAALRRTRDAYGVAKKNLDAQYNLAGVYGSGEHLAAQADLQQRLTNAEADLFAQTEARNFELARTAKYQAIQDSLGVDKEVMDDLVGLTGLDVQVAAMMYGAKVEDVKAIREALGTIGSELLMKGNVQGQAQQQIQ